MDRVCRAMVRRLQMPLGGYWDPSGPCELCISYVWPRARNREGLEGACAGLFQVWPAQRELILIVSLSSDSIIGLYICNVSRFHSVCSVLESTTAGAKVPTCDPSTWEPGAQEGNHEFEASLGYH